MRSRAIAVIAVSLVLIAGAAGFQLRGQILHLLGADRPIPGTAPNAIGNTWACPSGWLKTYQSGMVYYPPYHPAPPPLEIKPVRCYRTEGEARSAGYKLAPATIGGAVLSGIYLVATGPLVKASCKDAAAQLRIVIPCLAVLPAEVANSLCSPSSECTSAGGFMMSITLTTPPDFPGALDAQGFAGRGQVQVLLAAMQQSSPVGQQINVCLRGKIGPTVMERPSQWVACTYPNSRPGEITTWLTWQFENAIYVMGSSDQTSAAGSLVEMLASKLVSVSPRSS